MQKNTHEWNEQHKTGSGNNFYPYRELNAADV